jgi:phosphosulfolactate phosphohydrolase-like enzyme
VLTNQGSGGNVNALFCFSCEGNGMTVEAGDYSAYIIDDYCGESTITLEPSFESNVIIPFKSVDELTPVTTS